MLNLDGHKLHWHKERVDAYLAGGRIAPITIDMALTQNCSFKCVYCYAKMQQNKSKMLSNEILRQFIDDASDMGVKAISLVSDGESTNHSYWVGFINYGKQSNIDMALGTNGYNISYEDLKKVLPALTYIRFNISAADEKEYCRVHGVKPNVYQRVLDNIKTAVELKKRFNLKVTIGLQMVLMPSFIDQVMSLVKLGKKLGVDYLMIKHCSDDENSTLGIDYSKYKENKIIEILQEAEKSSTEFYQVAVKWSKITQGREGRSYSKCYGPPIFLQISGSGIIAPCGSFFNKKYSQYHIGNLHKDRLIDLMRDERYWAVMNELQSDRFDAKTMCACLCLQHKVNEYLDQRFNERSVEIKEPEHVNFI